MKQSTALLDLSVREFLARLGSDAPTPGGGACAALAGALAASLGSMVCALTIGRKKFSANEPEAQRLHARFQHAAAAFSLLVEEDAAAYQQLSDALKLPRDDQQRTTRIEQSAETAALIPLETAGIALALLHDFSILRRIGNPNLAADVLAGIAFARAAVSAAEASVRANMPLLSPDRQATTESQLEKLLSNATLA